MSARACAWALLACAALTGCDAAQHAARGLGVGSLGAGQVASVDGVAIAVADVQRLVERGGLSPKQALARLEAQELLASEAERRGYAASEAVQQVAEQALVQVLLQREVESDKPSDAEIQAAYESSGARFNKPERRVATHLLAVLPKQPTPEQDAAARAFTADAILQLKAAADPAVVFHALATKQTPLFQVKVEELPPATREGSFVEPFSKALFELEKPGVSPQPVRTEFGWHAIWLREILPSETLPEATARAELARELEQSGRQRRADALVRQLEQRARIAYAPKLRDTLAALEF